MSNKNKKETEQQNDPYREVGMDQPALNPDSVTIITNPDLLKNLTPISPVPPEAIVPISKTSDPSPDTVPVTQTAPVVQELPGQACYCCGAIWNRETVKFGRPPCSCPIQGECAGNCRKCKIHCACAQKAA